MRKFFGAPSSKSKSTSTNKPYTADPGVASYEHGVHDPSEPSFTTDNLLLAGASNAYSLGPMTYSAPPSPDPSAFLAVYPERPLYDRGNSAYIRAGDPDRDQWPRTEDGWDYVRVPEPRRQRAAEPPPGLVSSTHSPPFPSRSSSLGSLPLGASTPPPTASTVTPSTFHYHYPSSETGQARHGNALARILRKKPPSITDRVSLGGGGGGGGAAAVLRTLDPHGGKHHDDRRLPEPEFFDPAMTRASADSYDAIQSSEDDARSSVQLDREREWRERDREIREAEKKDKDKKPKGQEHHTPKHHADADDRAPAIQRSKTKDKKRKDEKKWATFFSKDRDRDDRSDGEETPAEQLTRMIGYLTATGSQDWALVLEVCERASANEANAKAAAKALRREFKYGC